MTRIRCHSRFALSACTALLCVSASLTGCADERDGAPTTTVRDSAGMTIIEVHPTAWPPREVWQVVDTPDVDIGVREGNPDQELFQVRGAIGLPTGGMVVAEFGARLRYYDGRGVHLRTLERAGNGPGEAEAFQEIYSYRGDSLLIVIGHMHARRAFTQLLVLDNDGSYGRDIMAWYPGERERGARRAWLSGGGVQAALADGSFVGTGAIFIDLEQAVGGIVTGRVALTRHTPEGELVDTIAILPNGWFEDRAVDRRNYELMLDDPDPPPVRTRGMHIYYTTGERFSVDIYEARALSTDSSASTRPSARLARSHRILVPPVATTAESRERYISRVIDIYSADDGDRERAEYRRRLESLRSPDSIPAVQDLRVDASGHIWLEVYEPPGARSRARARGRGLSVEPEESKWIVLDPEGELIGAVLMPVGLEVLEIGSDHVLGLWHDEFGVAHVRRHALIGR